MNKKRYLVIGIIVATIVLLLTSSCTTLHIVSLEAEAPGWTAPSGSLRVTCNASGSELSYNWSTGGGGINGTGAVVDWIAPEEAGMYDITVVVSNSQGRQDRASITLIASNGPPPIIGNLIVTAEHKYLKTTATGYKVAKTYNYTIECIASGNGTLSYNWTCTGGDISGESSTINWTAPNMVEDVTVTAKVFDGLGNWVKESVLLTVVPCTPCEFE